jgi:carboxyl-terminal processing protease
MDSVVFEARRRRTIRRLLRWLGLLLVLISATGSSAAGPRDVTVATTEVFDQVWQTVKNKFYDPALHGVDWDAVKGRYRPLVAVAVSEAERAAIFNRMLHELGASHTAYLTANEPAYYDLLDIFAGGLRLDLKRLFSDGEVAYTGIGIFTQEITGKTFVRGVLDGLPADQAGLRQGDEIVAVDGKPYAPIGSFVDRRGRPVTLAIRRVLDGPVLDVSVVPERIRPNQAFLRAMAASARVIEQGAKKIGYIHVWSYAGRQFQALLERELHSGKLKDADALIWDLRDGWGGAQVEYLDMFNGRGPLVDLIDRAGKQSLENVKWQKPVAMLINGGTRSGKEILAYGFKKYGFGEVIGTRTTGAVLAARAFLMADDSLLELAVGDVRVDGERLEGTGVAPTIEVPFRLEYAHGWDPQLQRAVSILSTQGRQESDGRPQRRPERPRRGSC